MAEEQVGGQINRAYREHRPYLVDLAFRMLGDIGAAEDVVQDAFWRLMSADIEQIEDERGWLIVVTSRLYPDRIRSARSRRERSHDSVDIEFAALSVQPAQPPPADSADRVTFDGSVRLALLVVLQKLSPAERVVFVLHDIFQMPFDTIAQTVGRLLRPALSSPGGPGRRSRLPMPASASTSLGANTGRSPTSSSRRAPPAIWTACSRC
jgi:RNA polymerase sigma-70 factor (ECF subfamily)